MTVKQEFGRRFQPTLSYAKEFNTVCDLQKEPVKFLWFQLLTAMVENMTDDEPAIVDMLSYAPTQYADNEVVLKQITKFGDELNSSEKQFDALRWYTIQVILLYHNWLIVPSKRKITSFCINFVHLSNVLSMQLKMKAKQLKNIMKNTHTLLWTNTN